MQSKTYLVEWEGKQGKQESNLHSSGSLAHNIGAFAPPVPPRGGGGGDGPTSFPSIHDHNMHARCANIASSVEFGLPSEIVTAVEIVEDRLTGLYSSQVLHQAKTPPKGNFSSSRLFTKAPSDHSNRVRSFAVASL
ncbi:hypothetical protein AVEN_242965-1 [Araneus ventricosus]|uniref:Uncharacterized protein n=1 Tax=Araneus ventricosus TaxID=182803 RepID=A0A4Y1ZT76_ARAVE|nr:hypothetical protein AVEN_242965-1 [Araneus ventricosus]